MSKALNGAGAGPARPVPPEGGTDEALSATRPAEPVSSQRGEPSVASAQGESSVPSAPGEPSPHQKTRAI